MSIEEQEYVFAPWGSDDRETAVVQVALPSRELIVQLEAPTDVLERMQELGDRHDIPTEQALAERLEVNRARVSVLAARSADDLAHVRSHLREACSFLDGVDALDTTELEADIRTIWRTQLDAS